MCRNEEFHKSEGFITEVESIRKGWFSVLLFHIIDITITIGTSHHPITFCSGLGAQLLDLRSTVVRSACRLLVVLGEALGRQFQDFVVFYLPRLLSRLYVTVKVISNSSDQCIHSLLIATRPIKCINKVCRHHQRHSSPSPSPSPGPCPIVGQVDIRSPHVCANQFCHISLRYYIKVRSL